MLRNEASFRDPDGYVFHHDGGLYRGLTEQSAALFAKHQRFYADAVDKGLLVAFDEAPAGFGFHTLIAPEELALVTYPHEWSYEQLKDAALLTLDINLLALEHGLTLKDATAFNVQRLAGRSVFIDHTSFEETLGGLPWRPYSQFCRHFLNPLVVGAYRDTHVGAFFRLDIDGLQQQLANDLLPLRARMQPSVLMHMVVHNRYIRKSSQFEGKTQAADIRSRGRQESLLRQLRTFIAGLSAARAASTWSDYYEKTNYVEAAFAEKKRIVGDCFAGRQLSTVWDIGANDGTFSRLVAEAAPTVLALDLDHNAVNANYAFNRRNGHKGIHALVYDVGNPTPALGFRNRERPTLEERSKPDMAIALAVIHHLSLTNNIPLQQSARYFAERTPELLIEWVGREDSQVRRLLAQKNIAYDWYTEENFASAFGEHYALVSRTPIAGTERVAYHFRSA